MTERTWESITTWQELLAHWEANTSEAGAVGLLYAAAGIRISDGTENAGASEIQCFKDKLCFLLEQAKVPNTAIALVARQLIIKELLDDCLALMWTGAIGEEYRSLLMFLGEPLGDEDELRKPPYPRFVSSFLIQVFHRWEVAVSKRWDYDKSFAGYAALRDIAGAATTMRLVAAGANWGSLAEMLSGERLSKTAIGLLRLQRTLIWEGLAETDDRRASAVSFSLSSAMKAKSPADIRDEDGRRRVGISNALAFLFLDNLDPRPFHQQYFNHRQ